jgi:nitrite reductase (NADH) small subunit
MIRGESLTSDPMETTFRPANGPPEAVAIVRAVTEFIDVGSSSDIAAGRMASYRVNGRRVVVYHTASGFHASDDRCPHRGGPLAEGDLMGEEIVCPWHLWGFDVRSGVCPGNPEVRVTTHEVRVENDRLLVRVNPVEEALSQP